MLDTRIHDVGDGLVFERVQDVEPILDFTKAMRQIGDVGSSEMRHAASLPMVLVENYCNTNGITFAEFMSNTTHVNYMLNDPALRSFRIWEGRV